MRVKNILVVGGAGYIGSHTCLDLHDKGYRPVVYDNLSNGHREFVQWGPFEEGDIRDTDRLEAVLARHSPDVIVHFAASIEVGESTRDPIGFYENNVAGTISLLGAARKAGIDRLVFSSTCATYGEPQSVPMSEEHRQVPVNPYGRSKLMIEEMLKDAGRYLGMRSVVLRYFNAAGADPEGRIGEWHEPETHAVPIAIEAALGQRDGFFINGRDYDTPDGTCVRDFVHVMDLADAHSRAVRHLIEGGESLSLNLGTGQGTTVRQLVDTVRRMSGREFPVETRGRRDGDAAALVADNSRAKEALGWSPRFGLEEIVASALEWHRSRLGGEANAMPPA
ncbi:UDP-glucose 4-epimerase GalE [Aquibium oceanicum]|uniref:UDP-glucose 4-epimerase GalE n=1 Tax=Aquibium oceanicum TaxID=1670800 RepID=UPI000DF82149|nr:UDP-glucose 4-epimerase GalE [Aquibium oceanicum]